MAVTATSYLVHNGTFGNQGNNSDDDIDDEDDDEDDGTGRADDAYDEESPDVVRLDREEDQVSAKASVIPIHLDMENKSQKLLYMKCQKFVCIKCQMDK